VKIGKGFVKNITIPFSSLVDAGARLAGNSCGGAPQTHLLRKWP
jgi:hypothetical protein